MKGIRFSALHDNDNGSTTSTSRSFPIKHKFAASLTLTQLEVLAIKDRKAEVNAIKKDIEILEKQKAERKEMNKRGAMGVEQKERADPEGVEEGESQYGTKKEDQDEASESEIGQGWHTVKRSDKR